MINCVKFSDVEDCLNALGFSPSGETGFTRTFARGDDDFTIREPNVDGNLPEILVNDAFHAAGMTPPVWNVFWCD